MNLKLSVDDWEKVVGSGNGKKVLDDIVFVMALEGDDPDPSWSFWHRALDFLVQTMQPSPVMTHVELFVPPLPTPGAKKVHFSTYACKTAGWEFHFENSFNFYLGKNASSWRAVPVYSPDLAARIREEGDRHVKTPYSLMSYVFSAPPGRALAWTRDDSPQEPCHCATLSARCMRDAAPSLRIPRSSAWYSPSTLFIEFSKPSHSSIVKLELEERTASVKSFSEVEATNAAVAALSEGSDDDVRRLSHADCEAAVLSLMERGLGAAERGDGVARAIAERKLAFSLLRWSQINHFRNRPTAFPSPISCEK